MTLPFGLRVLIWLANILMFLGIVAHGGQLVIAAAMLRLI